MASDDQNGFSAEIYKSLVDVGLVLLSEEYDLQRLLRRILDFSMELSSADAGSLYVIRDNQLHFSAWRNRTFEREHKIPLLGEYRLPIDNNTICGFVAASGQSLVIDNVRELSPDLPYHHSEAFDKQYGYSTRSMLTLPLTITSGQIVGVLQLINHMENSVVTPFPQSLCGPLRIMARQAGMALHNAMLSEGLKESQLETVYRLALAAETRDNETGSHLKRVSHYARILAHRLGRGAQFEELIFNAAPLHDVGKIGLPDNILKKAARFTDEERELMKTHTTLGLSMLEGSHFPLLQMGASIALTHHEKWNGTGYPNGLEGTQIPIEGRLMAVVDVFDALSCKRCYKEAWSMDVVLDTLRRDRGQHFDPEMVDLFLASLPEVLQVFHDYKEDN